MRSIRSYITGILMTTFFSLLANVAYAQLFQEISQTVRVTVTVVEGIKVGPCSFDPNQICTNEDEDGSFGTGAFGLRIINTGERPSITRALASITSLADLATPSLPVKEQPIAQIWDKRL